MNLGAFVAQVWLEVKPIKRWKAKRAAKKAAKHPEAAEAVNAEYFNEAQEGDMSEPKLRTSTKAGAAGLLTLVGGVATLVPFYDEINGYLVQACSADQGPLAFLVSGAVVWVVMWVTARRAKTATKPGIL